MAKRTGSSRKGSDASSPHDNPSAQLRLGSTEDRRPAKKSEIVARTLADELFLGEVPAGSVLDVEDDLVRRLNVSRATLREGLRFLEILGVVEARMGRTGGVAVRQPDASDFARITTLYLQFTSCTYRDLIEVYVQALPPILANAARGSTQDQRDELRCVMEEYDELQLSDQVRQVQDVMARFIGMLDNPIWIMFARSIHSVVSSQFELLLVPETEWPRVVRTLKRMASAVIEGDEQRATTLARRQAEAWLLIAEAHQADLLKSRIKWAS